jgi:hypothetical protein
MRYQDPEICHQKINNRKSDCWPVRGDLLAQTSSLDDLMAVLLGGFPHCLFIHHRKLALLNNHLAVDNDKLNVLTRGRVDDRTHGIVVWLQVGLASVNDE